MARAVWEHACPVTGRTKQDDERWTCFRCRERARLASVSYSMIEQMGRYSRCYGFGSIGRHRPLADKLLHEIPVVKCEPCAGTGDRIVDGLFMLYFGGVMAFMALWGADIVTLRLRTGRVVLLVLAAVFVVLFLVVMVHGVANMPD